MVLRLLEKSLLYIVIIILCLLGNQGKAETLGDVAPASINEEDNAVQLASLQPFRKQPHRQNHDEILYPQLFGSTETQSSDISIFPKWTTVLARYEGQKYMISEPCKPHARCPVRDWQLFLKSIHDKDTKEKVSLVNRYINQVKYVADATNWKTNDYWQTPLEFFEHNGDCEDYAITKYISLRMLGIPEDSMRIVVLKDEHLKAIHAVLIVYIDGQAYLLDNQIKQMINASLVRHYQPIYSINENHWWRHRASS